jgi:hypothetical protein
MQQLHPRGVAGTAVRACLEPLQRKQQLQCTCLLYSESHTEGESSWQWQLQHAAHVQHVPDEMVQHNELCMLMIMM